MSSVDSLPPKIKRALEIAGSARPFPYFVIDSVLDYDEYLALVHSFPDELLGDLEREGFSSFRITDASCIPETLSANWKLFLAELLSPDFKKRLINSCLSETVRRYPRIWRWMIYFRLRNPRNYQVRVAISGSLAGRYLPPHTDKSYKVLALVFYFAPTNWMSESEGTRFYVARSRKHLRESIRRFSKLRHSRILRNTPMAILPMMSCAIHSHSGSLNSERDYANEAWFNENFSVIFNAAFEPNKIAGFVKTNNSFHALDMRGSRYPDIRRSVLINLNLRHSLFAKAWQFLEYRLKRQVQSKPSPRSSSHQ